MSEHTCTNDFILLGTLPDDLTSVLQERELQCSVRFAETVVNEETTFTANECNKIKTNTDDSITYNIAEWVDEQEGVTWQAKLISEHERNLQRSFAESTKMSEPIVKGSELYYFILPNSWTRSAHTKLMSNSTLELHTTSNEFVPRTAVSASNEFSEKEKQQEKEEEESQLATLPLASQVAIEEVESVIDSNDVPALKKEIHLSSVTGCHIEHFNNFDSLYASEAHHSMVEELLHYLAPTRRYLHEILHYVFVEIALHDEFRAKYSVEDVEQILRYMSHVNAMEQYDLNEEGFVKIEIERFDSTRMKQNVANRAFLCLSNKFRRLALHVTNKSHTRIHTEENKNSEECVHKRESEYAEMAHVLRTMELYADRDVMISARTGGGGIMAGLASHKRSRQHDSHSEHDMTDSDVEQEHDELFNVNDAHDNNGANESNEMETNGSNVSERKSINDDDNIEINTSVMKNKVLMSEGDSIAHHSSSDHNKQRDATNKGSTINDNRDDGESENVRSNGKFSNRREQQQEEWIVRHKKQINANEAKRQAEITSLSQCGLELHNEDLSTLNALQEIQSASNNALQHYNAYYSREESVNTSISNGNDDDDVVLHGDSDRSDKSSNKYCSNERKMMIASETEFKTASAIYMELLKCYNSLYMILVKHETFTNSVGRWCAQYLTQCATNQLSTELNNWQERQRQPRRLLTELYVRLHKATYMMERELEEYATLHALLIL